MLTAALVTATVLVCAAMLLNLWRLLRGPALTDRILALDTLSGNGMVLLVIAGIARGTSIYFEAALLIALLGFVSTVTLCKYLLRGDVIE